jgi:hypothetical protein
LPLQSPRPRAQRRNRDGRRVVDKELNAAHALRGFDDAGEFVLLDIATPDPVGRDAGFLRHDAVRQLLGGHFEREEGDSVLGAGLLVLVGLGGIEADIGGERRLAHRGAAGEDNEIGFLQPAQPAVEIA